jgi:hypothetical protein
MVEWAERVCPLTARQRQHTWWRLDGGFGSDGSINWLLPRGYPLLVKGYGGRRAKATAHTLPPEAWQSLRADKWVAVVPEGVTYVLPTQTLAMRWRNARGQMKYALLVHTLGDYSPLDVVQLYEGRGLQEVEIKDDKLGLQLVRRRKQRWNAQATWVILTDIAHNLLTWTRSWMFGGSRFETYGPLRLIQDVLTIPGRLVFGGRNGDRLERVALQRSHPYAREMLACLSSLLKNLNG